VWASFFANKDRLAEFTDEQALIRFLSQMARAKVIDQCRKLMALKRLRGEEAPVELSELLQLATAREPTPSQTAISREQWQRLLEGLEDLDRQIVVLRSQGASPGEISRQLNIPPRTLRRKFIELSRRIPLN
jgi:DNA-directed RNA polymerase specialized sigma24 family protein